MFKSTEAALEKAKNVLKEQASDAHALETAANELLQASHKVAEFLYKQGQQGPQGGGQEHSESSKKDKDDEGPIDAEINQ